MGFHDVTPVTYMNSTAAIKAFCGERGGAVCTSSNCRAVFKWAFQRQPKIFFLPDEHLGRNTALAMGIAESEILVWDPMKPDGGLSPSEIANAKVVLWKGCCSVHTKFQRRHVDERRAEDPEVKILVHPEVPHEVAGAADVVGSTETIIRTLREAPPGGRNRIQSREPARARDAGQEDRHPVERFLHLRYDVPDFTAESVVGSGATCRRRSRQSDSSARADAHVGEAGAGSDAAGDVTVLRGETEGPWRT
jgi:Quinolinate synthetase A protein